MPMSMTSAVEMAETIELSYGRFPPCCAQALPDLLQYVCAKVVRLFGYQFVWVGHKEDGGEIAISARAGKVAGYQDEL